ncbi:MAG: hypothetical protein ACFHHU_00885 [Porticoccaceae bacterium]
MEGKANVRSRKKIIIVAALTGIFAVNYSPASAAEKTLNEKIETYCAARGQAERCRSEQLSAALAQQQSFMSAYWSQDSITIAAIARCAKKNTDNAGVNYVEAQRCFETRHKP